MILLLCLSTCRNATYITYATTAPRVNSFAGTLPIAASTHLSRQHKLLACQSAYAIFAMANMPPTPLKSFLAELKVSISAEEGRTCTEMIFIEDNARSRMKHLLSDKAKPIRRCFSLPESRWAATFYGVDEASKSDDDLTYLLSPSSYKLESEGRRSRWESLTGIEKSHLVQGSGNESITLPIRSYDVDPWPACTTSSECTKNSMGGSIAPLHTSTIRSLPY